MSTLSAVTIGAAASKKDSESPKRFSIADASASEVRGPVATTVIASPGRSVISSLITSIFGLFFIPSVTSCANCSLSTASAPPAGTLHLSAQVMRNEPSLRISSFNSPAALSTRIALSEFEQTSSPNKSDLCAGDFLTGFIS